MKTAPMFVPPDHDEALRAEVRNFLDIAMVPDAAPGLGMGAGHDPEFSAALAARGWVGMSLPRRYGGSERGAVDRWIVVEELLAAGAPVGAHWLADRQIGPLIAKVGSDYLKERFLPEIAAGRCWFSVGLSEPDSGSDLASVRTAATKVDGGWTISGTKIWTSGAHLNQYITVLCRTDPADGDRHRGLSQIIVDLAAPGLQITPIKLLDGSHHFNELSFTDVFAPDEMLLGQRGAGWAQVTSELVSERSGPDRYMSVYQLLRLAVEHIPELLSRHSSRFGELLARFAMLRRMSLSVAVMIDAGESPGIQVPLIKDLGTTFEQETVAFLRDIQPQPQSIDRHANPFEQLLARATLQAPTFTLRGGTNEVLRNLIARELT